MLTKAEQRMRTAQAFPGFKFTGYGLMYEKKTGK
jgi:hypothetical protein